MSHGHYHLQPDVSNLSQFSVVVMPGMSNRVGGVMQGDGTVISSNGVLSLAPANQLIIGGVKIGANISVAADGTISVAAPAAAPVASVFGRTGAVTAQAGDYTAAQVTNAVNAAGSYADPAWITSLAWSKISGAPQGGQNQTPWLSNIDAAGFQLSGVLNVVGKPASNFTVASNGAAPLILGTNGKNRMAFDSGGQAYFYPRDADGSIVVSFGGSYLLADLSNNVTLLAAASLTLGADVATAHVALSTDHGVTRLTADAGGVSIGQGASNYPVIWFGPSGGAAGNFVSVDYIASDTISNFYIGATASKNLILQTNNTARVSVAANGNVTVGNGDNGYGTIYLGASQRAFIQALDANGAINLGGYSGIAIYTANKQRAVYNSNGVLTLYSQDSSAATLYVQQNYDAAPGQTYGAVNIAGGDAATQLRIGCSKIYPSAWLQGYVDAAAAIPILLQPYAGNVGIGTATPGALLDVAGAARVSGAAGQFQILDQSSGHDWSFLSTSEFLRLRQYSGSEIFNISPTTGVITFNWPIYLKDQSTGNPWQLFSTVDVFHFRNYGGTDIVQIGANGLVQFNYTISTPGMPSANPGVGSKQLWYDPADGNRVKFAA